MSSSEHSWPLFPEFNTLLIKATEKSREREREGGEERRWGGGREESVGE